jgi:hypothetical protein
MEFLKAHREEPVDLLVCKKDHPVLLTLWAAGKSPTWDGPPEFREEEKNRSRPLRSIWSPPQRLAIQ